MRMSSNRMIFRLKNSTLAQQYSRPINIRNHSFRNSDHLLDDHVIENQELTTESIPESHSTQHYRRRQRQRKRQRTTTTSTTTTTTTTEAPIDDYYEYSDDYDDDYSDYIQTTTTTTTTTSAPKRRRGRRRFRRPTEPPTTTTTTTLSPNYKPRPDGRIIDYLADPNFPYELKGADLTEYPFYISIPENTFSCKGRHDGYYANIDLKCQVYHHCAIGHQRYDFLCPNYTLFDQTTFTCRFVNSVDCDSSEKHYDKNMELYIESTTPTINATLN